MENQNLSFYNDYICEFNRILCVKSNEMLCHKTFNSITCYFINTLNIMNTQIIGLCNNILTYTNIAALKQVVENIICDKKQELKKIDEFVCNDYHIDPSLDEDITNYLSSSTTIIENTIVDMKYVEADINVSKVFVLQMLANIQGLIELCDNVLQYDISEELKTIINYTLVKSRNYIAQLEQISQSI